jgi:hypothetical protein
MPGTPLVAGSRGDNLPLLLRHPIAMCVGGVTHIVSAVQATPRPTTKKLILYKTQGGVVAGSN